MTTELSTSPTTVPPAGVVVVDHERAMGEALAQAIGQDSRIASASWASTEAELLQRLAEPGRHVMVIRDDGAEGRTASLLVRVLRDNPDVPVIVYSDQDDPQRVARLVRAGARGWLSADADVDAVCRAVSGVAEGQWWLPRQLLGLAVRDLGWADPATPASLEAPTGLESLTARERQVLDALTEGMTRAQIAEHLSLSVNTVRTHIQHLLVRLGVHTSLEAVSLALRERSEESSAARGDIGIAGKGIAL